MGLKVVILAAGKGKRMASSQPKISHTIGGIPMLEHVVNTARTLEAEDIFVIYGNGGERVPTEMSYLPVKWIKQKEQLGTGHAVKQALPFCDNDDDQVLVLYGDVPLISTRTLRQLVLETPYSGLGLVVTELEDPTGFGRIVRNEFGNIIKIIEHKDANQQQLKINEINTGILITSVAHLKSWLPRLKDNNKQQEYYLTDIVSLAVDDGFPVGGVMAHGHEEVSGVNDRWQLATLERYYQQTLAKKLTYSGVTVLDPARLDIRGQVKIAPEVILDVNVIMEGSVKIGAHSKIGPNVYLKDVEIGEHVEILANSVVEGSKIFSNTSIGPFARLRAGTVIEEHARVGNFVEIKKTVLGEGSKASHLTYLGDAIIGKEVNIGAGTITCNYDGVEKWQTQIGDSAFIGSNTSLVAPIKIGKDATVAAGSTLNQDAPDNQLTIARAQQRSVRGWKHPSKRKSSQKES